MTDSEQTRKQTTLGETGDAPTFRIENADVIKRGQITIEKDTRNDYDIEIGDYVDLEVYHGEKTIHIPDTKIGESGRVTIPSRQRERYGITEGDELDVGVLIE